MDQPRPGTQIKRDLQAYRISGAKLPWPIFWRDLILTLLVWVLFGIGLYNAFLYVENNWFNRLPNPTRQQLVNIREFAKTIQFYAYFSVVVLVLMFLRLMGNIQFWYSTKEEAVTLTQIPVEEQAKFFGAEAHAVAVGRKAKMTYVHINKQTGKVASLVSSNDPHFRPTE